MGRGRRLGPWGLPSRYVSKLPWAHYGDEQSFSRIEPTCATTYPRSQRRASCQQRHRSLGPGHTEQF
eukprot:10617570-Alexandrium_andersonii.AAC.1